MLSSRRTQRKAVAWLWLTDNCPSGKLLEVSGKYDGIGVGLAVVQEVVRIHGGSRGLCRSVLPQYLGIPIDTEAVKSYPRRAKALL